MLKTVENYKSSTDFINEDLPLQTKQQTFLLDSNLFNDTFKSFEDSLNKLYEKVRVLNDIIDYIENFADYKISTARNHIINNMKLLNLNRDRLKTNESILVSDDFTEDHLEIYKDRDGSVLNRCVVSNGNLVMSNTLNENNTDFYLTKKSPGSIVDRTDIIGHDRSIISVYKTNEIISDGIKETIHIDFAEPVSLNYINLDLLNAKIESAKIIESNGNETLLEDTTYLYFAETEIQSVEFVIISNQFTKGVEE